MEQYVGWISIDKTIVQTTAELFSSRDFISALQVLKAQSSLFVMAGWLLRKAC